ncbi:acyl- synthetase family member 3, mitochondrial-like [Lecanosticta acicola]|uniref:Acyl- synthetase family member 3, mitochondrial-like n=1 Tax=Lecanosticta acicola TaxID=111012 RepID=A0AAI9E8U8_9PEZI|nr:acyl- synthetase family member 3, mitochondrial-like [Lecanosticta acicola]
MPALQRSAFTEAIQKHDPKSTAVVHSRSGRTFKYGGLLQDIAAARDTLLESTGKSEESIRGERIAFLVENSYDYVVTLLACLASNAIAVPLAPSFTPGELRYSLNQSEAVALLHSGKFEKMANEILKEGLERPPARVAMAKILSQDQGTQQEIELTGQADKAEGGMMLYTSGTTARPKGVLLPHKALVAQAKSLLEAWDYTPKDHLLHVLPLHHIHGTVNALLTPILAGSTIEFMFPFNVDAAWNRFAAPFLPNGDRKPITFFTVVPTIWARMLQSHPGLPEDLQKAGDQAIKRENLRLNISGSAALPTPTKRAWTDLSSGNVLLERYGMTEAGMALSCGLDDSDRIDGSVGWPLPSVQARLIDTDTNEDITDHISTEGKDISGEIQLKGPTIFKEYWNNPEATAKEFTHDGWFKTGDIALRREVKGAGLGKSGEWARGPAWFIQGRKSADIIKTGGEKVSALEIERELLSLPEVNECAVVGLPSAAWGQKVAAVIVLSEKGKSAGKGGKEWSALDMRRALHGKLVAYKIPQDMKVVEELPRNAMGKINKKELVPKVFGDSERIRRRSVLVAEERLNAKAKQQTEQAQANGGAADGTK